MTTNLNGSGAVRLAVALAGLIGAGVVVAQQAPAGGSNLPTPRVQTGSCADVAWDKDMLSRYPRIAEGCQEVVLSNGMKWARFEADLVSVNRDGSVTLEFKDRQGRSMEELTMLPARTQRVSIAGRSYQFSELQGGQTLSLYVPEGMFALATTPGAPTASLAPIVPSPAAVAPGLGPDRGAGGQPLVAQVEPAPRATAQTERSRPVGAGVLPSTAGPLPLLVLAGLVSMLGGLGLTIRRRFLDRT